MKSELKELRHVGRKKGIEESNKGR